MLPVFKTGERQVHPVSGVFDSHTLPPFPFCSLPWPAMSAV
jgi:hypothetical protein